MNDPIKTKENAKKRIDDYHRRIERLKQKGKYEDYLAKRLNQARKLYEKLNEDKRSKQKEKDRGRFKKPLDKMKEEGTYHAYLDKCTFAHFLVCCGLPANDHNDSVVRKDSDQMCTQVKIGS